MRDLTDLWLDKLDNLIAGLQIVRKYAEPGFKEYFNVGHAVFYAGIGDDLERMTKEDVEWLSEGHGWSWDAEYECWSVFV